MIFAQSPLLVLSCIPADVLQLLSNRQQQRGYQIVMAIISSSSSGRYALAPVLVVPVVPWRHLRCSARVTLQWCMYVCDRASGSLAVLCYLGASPLTASLPLA
eukprot:scpid38500/ scgid8354/ 